MGPQQFPHVGDRRPHLQRGGLLRDHEHGVEEAQRPREELETRVQGVCLCVCVCERWTSKLSKALFYFSQC